MQWDTRTSSHAKWKWIKTEEIVDRVRVQKGDRELHTYEAQAQAFKMKRFAIILPYWFAIFAAEKCIINGSFQLVF